MNEQVARDVMLVRAIESTDRERRILSDDDRMYASRSANELAQWEASEKQSTITPELFLQKRSEQILRKLSERTPAFSRFAARRNWLRMAGAGLPALALLSGALADRIADPHRVDLLSAPLLLIIVWNLVAYVALLAKRFIPSVRARSLGTGLLARLTAAKLSSPRRLPQPLARAMAAFGEEWMQLSAPLNSARLKRIIHFSAACFALGAVLSLYARGIFTEYRAGWESTFLNAEQVHGILSALFMPAIAFFGLPGFSIEDVKALQFAESTSRAGGARWVHLYAATLLLLVILPRLMLALVAAWKEKRLADHFPLDLGQPYFRKLTGSIGATAPAVLRVYPYSFTVDEARDKHLTEIARMMLGEQARVMLRPLASYGEEPPDASGNAAHDDDDAALTAALFNLSATPEKENHGAFLDRLQRNSPRGVSVLIDESAYLERIGAQPGGEARVRERIALWRQFCDLHNMPAGVINLLDPHARTEDIERGLFPSARTR
jgi:hypothetical protein